MKSKRPKQVELPFKPTEFQLDLLVGKTHEAEDDLQFFASRNCQMKSRTTTRDACAENPKKP
ncbi:hypothetical protein ACFODZ_02250 [Marinicella sediminis]|uniref:Uncharacterized protein n=1 Tax=Marinicella sediminis TaxID=1792834 RepID=A0ABV7J4H0_9GAMM|nr:hypothetical protein [Marinicella sediminis]